MIDTGLITEVLRSHGHTVGYVNKLPDNAGAWEFEVDGNMLTLDEARALMEADDLRVAETIQERGPLTGVQEEIE